LRVNTNKKLHQPQKKLNIQRTDSTIDGIFKKQWKS
jgi:hypothetical protein